MSIVNVLNVKPDYLLHPFMVSHNRIELLLDFDDAFL